MAIYFFLQSIFSAMRLCLLLQFDSCLLKDWKYDFQRLQSRTLSGCMEFATRLKTAKRGLCSSFVTGKLCRRHCK